MKKRKLCALFLLLSLFLSGCTNNGESLTLHDLTNHTLLITKDGKLQEGIVENFDKSYYDKKELKEYIEKEIAAYNAVNGKKSVTNVSLSIKSKKAKVILNFKDMNTFAKFNDITASYLKPEEAKMKDNMPDQYVSAKDSSLVDKDTALKGQDYKVLILSDTYNVVVSGKILYYYNAALLNTKSVQTLKDDNYSVIVYEP